MVKHDTAREWRNIDRTVERARKGVHVQRREYPLERVPFAKCGTCTSYDVHWRFLDAIQGLQLRECYVCGERANIRNVRGNVLEPVLRQR